MQQLFGLTSGFVPLAAAGWGSGFWPSSPASGCAKKEENLPRASQSLRPFT